MAKRVVIEKPGGYDQLKIKEFSPPALKSHEVLIETYAIGINYADCVTRMGLYSSAKEFIGWPITPGFELAGVVKEVGKNVSEFSVGQKVCALNLFGCYATHLVVPADQVYLLPQNFSFEEGAGFPTIFLTAYYGLIELCHPIKGNTILVHSAAGGVGSALVQLGKLAGCKVAGVVGASHKVKAVLDLGADFVIDKSTDELWQKAEEFSPEGFDIILDANGVETLHQSYNHIKRGGKLVVYGFHTMLPKGGRRINPIKLLWNYFRTPRFNPLYMTVENRSVMAFNLSYFFQGKNEVFSEMAKKLLSLANEGKLRMPNITVFPFEKVADAQKALESGETVGKVVLGVKPGKSS
jgi:NADPH:quinone reductase-like Zn-dependent oxidoreductase